jgi:Holliday junction resolvase
MEKKKKSPTLEDVWAALDRTSANIDKLSADADKRLKKLEKDIFGIGRNNGYYAEEFFQHVFSKKCELAGIKFDGMIPNLKYEGKESCEFDIVLVNGDSVAIIEAKYRIHPNFVKELVTDKLAQFRKYFPVYKNHAVYFGIAGMSFSQEVVKNAKEHGVAIVRQNGQKVVLDTLPTKTY